MKNHRCASIWTIYCNSKFILGSNLCRSNQWLGKTLENCWKVVAYISTMWQNKLLRYANFYLEKMRQLPDEFSEIYDHLKNEESL